MKLIILVAGLALFTAPTERARAQGPAFVAVDSVNARLRTKAKGKSSGATGVAQSRTVTPKAPAYALHPMVGLIADGALARAARPASPPVPPRAAPSAKKKTR